MMDDKSLTALIRQYADIYKAEQVFEKQVAIAANLRAWAVAEIHLHSGLSYRDIATLLHLSLTRVQQLVEKGRLIRQIMQAESGIQAQMIVETSKALGGFSATATESIQD